MPKPHEPRTLRSQRDSVSHQREHVVIDIVRRGFRSKQVPAEKAQRERERAGAKAVRVPATTAPTSDAREALQPPVMIARTTAASYDWPAGALTNSRQGTCATATAEGSTSQG